MLDAKAIITPLSLTDTLKLHDGTAKTDPAWFQQVLGSMQYLSLTRPDISFFINKLSQFMHCPSSHHWTVVKRLLRYLKGTSAHGIFLDKETTHAFSDSNWASNFDDCTLTLAYIVFIGASLINWVSKK